MILGCEEAVASAATALPADHPRIVSIGFHYGKYCQGPWSCPVSEGDFEAMYSTGYVIFWTALAAEPRGIMVEVTAEAEGHISVRRGHDVALGWAEASRAGHHV